MEGAVKERWIELCELITKEQDSKKFCALVEELNRLLDEKEQRLKRQETEYIKRTRT